jgi:hypothetical protein
MEVSYSLVSVLGFMLIILILVPVYAITQDRKDLSFIESQIKAKKYEILINTIAQSNEDVAAEWRYKQDEIQAY